MTADDEPATTEPSDGARQRRIGLAILGGVAVIVLVYLWATGALRPGPDRAEAPDTGPLLHLDCSRWTDDVQLPGHPSLSLTYAHGDEGTAAAHCTAAADPGWAISVDARRMTDPAFKPEVPGGHCRSDGIPVDLLPQGAVGCFVPQMDPATGQYTGWRAQYSHRSDEGVLVTVDLLTFAPNLDRLATGRGTTVKELLMQAAANAAGQAYRLAV